MKDYLRRKLAKNVKAKGKQSYNKKTKSCTVNAVRMKEATPTTAARVIGSSVQTVYNWLKNGIEEKKRGPARMITDGSPEKERLEQLASEDPYGRLIQIAERLAEETGVNPSYSTAKRQLYSRASPKFTLKTADKSTEEKNLDKLLDMQKGYIDGLNFALSSGRISIDQLCFMDEFPIYAGKVPVKGRVRKGEKLYCRAPYMATRYTGVICITSDACVKVDVFKGNTDDAQCKKFCLESQSSEAPCRNLRGPGLGELLPRGSFLIWDRLGRSGRCRDPKKIHYNPDIISNLAEHGIKTVHLPPKGHLFNPAEVAINAVQQLISRWHPPGNPVNEYGQTLVGPRSFDECRLALSYAISSLSSSSFQGFFKARVRGEQFLARCAKSRSFADVELERQEVAVIWHWPSPLL